MSDALEVGKKLVDLCRQGKHLEAVETLYSPAVVSIEAGAPQGQSPQTEGIEKVREKNKWWTDNHEIHSADAHGPFPNGNRFIVHFKYDVTANGGPASGKRFQLDEAALYTVQDGKIVKEEFFYHMGG